MLRRSLTLALAALVSLAGAGCSGGGEAPSGGGDGAKKRDTLVIAELGDIGSLISIIASSNSDSDIVSALNMPVIDSEFDCSLKKLPGLVKEWNWSDDGTVLSVTLRDDVTFSDGKKVTAEDIAFTYELIADPNVSSPRFNYIERMKPEGRPKVIDATHLEWHFTQAYDRDTQIAQVSLPPLPKHILKDADRATLKGHPYGKNPLSTGPWKLAKYEPNERIVLEPNENFTGPEEMRPKLARVVLKIIPEYATRLLELQNGEVDMMESITVADADMLRKSNPNINLVRQGYRSSDYVAWNMRRPMFADKRVRQALAMSVDVDDMIAKLLTSQVTNEAYARRSIGTITPELCGVHNDDIAPIAYDAEKAKALFAEAGWKDTDGDGVLDKDGKPFEFTLVTNNGNKRRADIAIRLQSAFKDVGVKMNIDKMDFNAMTDKAKARDYDAMLSGWVAGLFIDPADQWYTESPDKPREFNYPGYSNPEVDALIDRGLNTPKPEEAAPIWKEMQAKIYEDQPYLFLWWMDQIVGIDNRFTNYTIDILSTKRNLHEWDVPPDRVKYGM